MNWIEEAIKKSGAKITSVRKAVAGLLIDSDLCTFKVQDIIDQLPTLDRVSVYRTVELLEELDVIHPTVVVGGAQHYEMHGHANHHHHAFCNSCGTSECEDCPISEKEEKHHVLSYSFLCVACTN